MLYLLPRARFPIRAFNKLAFHRAHHSATGKFITISPHATPVAREIEVWLGDLGNAYVMLGPEISQNFQTATMLQGGCSLAQDQELFPLTFHHGTRHFSHSMFAPMIVTPKLNIYYLDSSPYPRFEIPQDLPQQSNAHSSPATFHAYGVTHAIMLDGTPDGRPAHCYIYLLLMINS